MPTIREQEEVTIPFSGSRTVIVRENDTFQLLAQRYLGNDELWPFIAELNGFNDNSLLLPGIEVRVPIVSGDRVQYLKDQYFLDFNFVKNPYGVDLQLDVEGDILIGEAGDVNIVGGIDNVLQAVSLKVTATVGSALKHTAIGLATTPGTEGTDLAQTYIRMHLRRAVLQDPRVESVDNIVLFNRGTVVQATIFFRLVGYNDLQNIEVDL